MHEVTPHNYDRRAASPQVFWIRVFRGSVKRDSVSFNKAKEDASSWSQPSDEDWAGAVLTSFFARSRTVAKDVAGALSDAAHQALLQADFFEGGSAVYDNGTFKVKLEGPVNADERKLREILKFVGLTDAQIRVVEKSDAAVYHVAFEFPPPLLDVVAKRIVG